MIEIGASLAAARRARGLDLRAAERLTCMRGRYLLALEEERFDQLPGRTYARAFLRSYAAALGLEADRFVAEFDEQVPPEDVAEIVAPPPRRARRRSLRTPLVLAAAAALVGIVFWSGWNRSSTLPTAVATPKKNVPATAASVRPLHPVAKPKVDPALLVIRARGACWVQLRRGDANGPVLAERTLQAGDVVRVTLARVWLRLGAPWNVTVHRGAALVRNLPRSVPVDLYWTSAPGHVSESR
jgi:cytoskeleton protein RodZ